MHKRKAPTCTKERQILDTTFSRIDTTINRRDLNEPTTSQGKKFFVFWIGYRSAEHAVVWNTNGNAANIQGGKLQRASRLVQDEACLGVGAKHSDTGHGGVPVHCQSQRLQIVSRHQSQSRVP